MTRNIAILICLIYFLNWTISYNLIFAEDSNNVIVVDEIVVSTEDVEDEEIQEKKDTDEEINVKRKQKKTPLTSEPNLAETSQAIRAEIEKSLNEINKKLLLSADSFFYTVKGGDTLSKIADEFNTSYELIMKINNKYRTTIRIGERLKIIKGPFDIHIDKSDFKLTLLLNGNSIKRYRIGTGKDNKTPVGTFEIDEKMKEPVWYSGDGVYPFGHPKNILGTRWIGFKDKPDLYGYGIHGTAIPESIGKAESNGCIRLRNEDVEDLFTFVTNDTKVTIQD